MQPRPRTMSYRKPVPVYIPTPPPSPKDPVPVQAEPRVPEALHHDDVEQPQPPLPGNWKEKVHHGASRSELDLHLKPVERPLPSLPPADDHLDVDDVDVSGVSHMTSKTLVDNMSIKTAPSTTRSMSRTSSRQEYYRLKVKQHQVYRPPTPPAGTQRKASKSHESDSDDGPRKPAVAAGPAVRAIDRRTTGRVQRTVSLTPSPPELMKRPLPTMNREHREEGWTQRRAMLSSNTLVVQTNIRRNERGKLSTETLPSPDTSCWEALHVFTRRIHRLFSRN